MQNWRYFAAIAIVHFVSFSWSGVVDKDTAAAFRECEQLALKIGTLLADDFNAPISNEDADQRLHQNYLTEHLGFAPWMAGGVWKSGGKTLQNSDGII